MVKLEEVQRQVNKLKVSEWVVTESVKNNLVDVLVRGEEIKKVVSGEYRGHSMDFGILRGKRGCLFATDRRLIFMVATGGNVRTVDFFYDGIKTITSRGTKGNGMLEDIIISDLNYSDIVISHIPKSEYGELYQYAKSRVKELSSY